MEMKQARKPRSYASLKLRPNDRRTYDLLTGVAKNHSQILGTGIGGWYSREWLKTGIPVYAFAMSQR